MRSVKHLKPLCNSKRACETKMSHRLFWGLQIQTDVIGERFLQIDEAFGDIL